MGNWGTPIFSDDLAIEVRDAFRERIGEGLSPTAATDRLLEKFADELADDDEQCVVWLALAAAQWKLGQLEDRTQAHALRIIDTGRDLARWEPSERRSRTTVLQKLRAEITSPAPAAKPVRRINKAENSWVVGEVVAIALMSRRWTLLRVIGHHTDKAGRFAVCELLDWSGDELPSADVIAALAVKSPASRDHASQFVFELPKQKKDLARVRTLGIISTPSQQAGGYTAIPWSFVDRLMKERYNLE